MQLFYKSGITLICLPLEAGVALVSNLARSSLSSLLDIPRNASSHEPMPLPYGRKPLDPGLAIRANLATWLGSKPRLAFNARTVRAARSWQRRARAKFLECLGPPPPRVTPRRHVLERRRMDGYHRTTFTLTTAPRLKAICWLCIPDVVKKSDPKPAMIAMCWP